MTSHRRICCLCEVWLFYLHLPGSVATCLRCGGYVRLLSSKISRMFVSKGLLKSTNTWWRYGQVHSFFCMYKTTLFSSNSARTNAAYFRNEHAEQLRCLFFLPQDELNSAAPSKQFVDRRQMLTFCGLRQREYDADVFRGRKCVGDISL